MKPKYFEVAPYVGCKLHTGAYSILRTIWTSKWIHIASPTWNTLNYLIVYYTLYVNDYLGIVFKL